MTHRRPTTNRPGALALTFASTLAMAPLLPLATAAPAAAATITISCGHQSVEVRLCEEAAEAWSAESGHEVRVQSGLEQSNERYFDYLTRLEEGDASIDIYQIDVIWPSAMAPHLLPLQERIPEEEVDRHFESIVANNTVEGDLVAMPFFTDAGVLYYRRDLLEKHGFAVPESYGELAATALAVQEAERAAGEDDMWGFVFQGNAYEGLTTNALEWIHAFGGGRIIDEDGTITVDNRNAAYALAQAASWVGTIAPERVTIFVEEDARITFQRGNAVFMRNWPYAWTLVNGEDSGVAGEVGVAPLPRGTPDGPRSAALGGWQLAVSRYSENPEVAVEFVRYLTGEAEQKRRAIEGSFAPTMPALYEDEEILDAVPFFADLGPALDDAVPRPSSVTGFTYNNVSTQFWEAAHNTLSGRGRALDNLARLADRLELLKLRVGF